MSILAQIGTKVGTEIKTLDIRMSSAETAIVNLGGQTPPPTGNFTIEPVNWTNLTEINLSGEKLINKDFSSVTNNLPDNWSINSGTLDQSKLAQGIIKGVGSSVAINQMFSSPLAIGTKIVVKATRSDFGTGGVAFKHLKADGNPQGGDVWIYPSDGFVEYEVVTSEMHGITLSTQNGTHEISSVSVFQGAVSGGSVQTFTGGSIEKISGASGYNAGASSVQKIDGNKDGYVQFQIGGGVGVRVGLVTQDSDFEVDLPFKLHFGNGKIDLFSPFLNDQENYEIGDWFRIRHYSTNNEIKFQKRKDVYQSDATLRSSTYAVSDDSDIGLYVVFLKTDVGQQTSGTDVEVTLNRGYEIVGYSSASNSLKILDDNENNAWLALNNTSSDRNRGDAWEFATLAGQDYFTFYTHPVLSNGDDLYVDTSFYSVGSRLNDVQIAYK